MSDTFDHERTAMDRFAEAPEKPNAMVPAPQMQPLDNRIVGAQRVAVYRDERAVLTKLRTVAAAAGENYFYRFPVKNRREGRTDWIEGPSIKLANDLARIYGNNDVDVRVQDLGDAWLFYARFTDLETGYSLTRPFQQRKSDAKIGGEDDSRRLDIALQIGASKAIRNVICNALQTYADFTFEEARNALVDKVGKDLPKWRDNTVRRLAELKVDQNRVERVIGRTAPEWTAPDVSRVIAMMKAVQDGMATLDETFPQLVDEVPKDFGRSTPLPQAAPNTGTPKSELDQFAAKDPGPIPEAFDRTKNVVGSTVRDGAPTGAAEVAVEQQEPMPQPPPRKRRTSKATHGGHNPDTDAGTDEADAGIDSAERRPDAGIDSGSSTEHVDPQTGEITNYSGARTPPHGASPALVLLEALLTACEQAETPELMSGVSTNFKERIKALPDREDRLDLSEVGNAYARWRRDQISEEEMTDEVRDRRRMMEARLVT